MKSVRYYELLEQHDWTYAYSDDPSVYDQGRLSKNKLISISMRNKDLAKLYNAYSKYIFDGAAKPPKPT